MVLGAVSSWVPAELNLPWMLVMGGGDMVGGICAPSQPCASLSLQCSTPSDQT